MKRSPIQRRTPLKPKRSTPRRREAPQWGRAEWEHHNLILTSRAQGCCEWCGTGSGPMERHHRKRRRDGGDRLCNLLLLCRDCHRWVTEHPGQARRYGLIVSAAFDPVTVPVLWQKTSWCFLEDSGGRVPAFDVTDAHQ